MMKALVYRGPGAIEWTDVALPELGDPRDAIVPGGCRDGLRY